jgi:DNA repair exonuclease SbcCD ATPase subunit
MNEDNNLKAKMKLEEMKNTRANKTQNLTVNHSNDKQLNFQFFYEETLTLANMHQITPDELYLMGANMQLMSVNVKNQISMQQPSIQKTVQEMMEEKVLKDEAEGKIRVKPETIETAIPATEPITEQPAPIV